MQHRMREHGAKLASMILDDVATLYICGDGASMARDVEATIKQLFQVQTITTHPPTHSLTPATPTNSVSTLPLFAPPLPVSLSNPPKFTSRPTHSRAQLSRSVSTLFGLNAGASGIVIGGCECSIQGPGCSSQDLAGRVVVDRRCATSPGWRCPLLNEHSVGEEANGQSHFGEELRSVACDSLHDPTSVS